MAMDELKSMYTKLLNEGLLKQGRAMFVTDQFESEFLNPTGGSHVTGLNGIVRRRGLYGTDFFYTP
jgi:hypothetical protein